MARSSFVFGAFTKVKTVCHVHKANQVFSFVFVGGTLCKDVESSKEAQVMSQAGATSRWKEEGIVWDRKLKKQLMVLEHVD